MAEAAPWKPKAEPLVALAKERLSLAVDVLNDLALQNVPSGRERAVADFVVRASAYAEAHEAPVWLSDVFSDEELAVALAAELARVPGIEALGGEQILGAMAPARAWLKQALARTAGTLFDRAGNFASTKLLASVREPLNAELGRFFGDVFLYFNSRGDRGDPGPVPRRILEALDEVRHRPSGKPLVVIGHSLGGVISFDLLSHFRPELEVDLFVSVGSQVAHFEEMKLYRCSDKSICFPDRAKTPSNIKRWINVYDPVDVFAYSVDAVFDRVDVDAIYNTRTYAVKAHGQYLRQNRFYLYLRDRLEALS